MAIKNINEAQLVDVIGSHFSPSKEIDDPHRLIGREAYLTRIRRALFSPGRHVFIYGERGVGKTSLAKTAGLIAVNEEKNFIYVPCSEKTTFYEVISVIGNSLFDIGARMAAPGRGFSFNASLPVIGGGGIGVTPGAKTGVQVPASFSEALDIIKLVRSKLNGQVIIAVDELDRVSNAQERAHFAELLKNVSAVIDDVRFILCGIGANVDEILGEHLSAGRMFEAIEVQKLPHDALWGIVQSAANELDLQIDRGFKIRIGIISDGFPHFVHLIGECLFYAIFDDEETVNKCERRHFDSALKEALQKAEPSLRRIYQMATEKTKHKGQYEEALWALADRSSTRRQVRDIYESSYLRIANDHNSIELLTKEKLNERLLAMRKESHANILIGHGSGWFSFRENVVRGYVRLKAESEGIELVPDPTM